MCHVRDVRVTTKDARCSQHIQEDQAHDQFPQFHGNDQEQQNLDPGKMNRRQDHHRHHATGCPHHRRRIPSRCQLPDQVAHSAEKHSQQVHP